MKTNTSKPPVSPIEDTKHFLETLLFVADDPDHKRRPFRDSTIHDFHPDFVEAVNGFCEGFREFLSTGQPGQCLDPDTGERSFGGNVFFSLSGHGCGFWDDSDSEWGDAMQAAIEEYSGGKHRFEGLESNLAKFGGKIHLAYKTTSFRDAALARLFKI